MLGQAGLGVGVGVLVVWEAAFRKQIMQGEIKKAEKQTTPQIINGYKDEERYCSLKIKIR